MKRFELGYHGDSSDEENVIAVSNYDIAKKIAQFRSQRHIETKVSGDSLSQSSLPAVSSAANDTAATSSEIEVYTDNDVNITLSFIAHAAGIYALYNPAVQTRYYALKAQKLSQAKPSFLTQDALEKQVDDNMRDVKKWVGGKQSQEAIEAVTRELKSNVVAQMLQKPDEYLDLDLQGKFSSNSLKYNTENYVEDYFFGDLITTEQQNPINNFWNNFRSPSIAEGFVRKTLAKPIFDLSQATPQEFPVEFLAHLRLHNRDEKRHLANREKSLDSTWKIFDPQHPEVKLRNSAEWGYSRTYKSYEEGCRTELVFFQDRLYASYSYILSTLADAKYQESINTLLSKRVNIKKLDPFQLNEDVVVLWYLLFGCASIQNPAAIIHNNMALDLLSGNESRMHHTDIIKLQDALPMVAPGSIQQAMALNKEYSNFMPHKYSYQTKEDFPLAKTNSIITREAEVTKQWLAHKLGKGDAELLMQQSTKDASAIQKLFELIIESFADWGLPDVHTPTALVSANKPEMKGAGADVINFGSFEKRVGECAEILHKWYATENQNKEAISGTSALSGLDLSNPVKDLVPQIAEKCNKDDDTESKDCVAAFLEKIVKELPQDNKVHGNPLETYKSLNFESSLPSTLLGLSLSKLQISKPSRQKDLLTLLMEQIESGGEEEVRTILATHPSLIKGVDGDGWGVIHICAKSGQDKILKMLVEEFKADIDQRTEYGHTPMHVAAEQGKIRTLLTLKTLGADLLTLLMEQIESGGEKEVRTILAAHPSLIKGVDGDGWGVIHICAKSGQDKILKMLVEEFKADLDQRTEYGHTPMHVAAEQGKIRTLLTLKTLGADLSLKNRGHETIVDCLIHNHIKVPSDLFQEIFADEPELMEEGQVFMGISGAADGYVD